MGLAFGAGMPEIPCSLCPLASFSQPTPTSYGRDGMVQEGAQASDVPARAARDSARRVGKVRRLRAHRYPREVREGPQRLPGMRPPPPDRGRRVHRAPDRSGYLAGAVGWAPLGGPAPLRALPRAAQFGPEE